MHLIQYIGVALLIFGAGCFAVSAALFLLMILEFEYPEGKKPSRFIIHPGLGALVDGNYLSSKGKDLRLKCLYLIRTGFAVGVLGLFVNVLIAIFLALIMGEGPPA